MARPDPPATGCAPAAWAPWWHRLVLFMLGLLGFLVLNGQAGHLLPRAREGGRVPVARPGRGRGDAVPQGAGPGALHPGNALHHRRRAADQLKEGPGEDFLALTGTNPLLPLVEVNVNAAYARPDSLRWIVQHLQQDERTQEVAYNAALVENIDANLRKLGLVLLGFCALLLIIAVALINNTIRLAVYSKRFLIRTMHLVGATHWFIKRPFLAPGPVAGPGGRRAVRGPARGCPAAAGALPAAGPHGLHRPEAARRAAARRGGAGLVHRPGEHLVRRAALPSHEHRRTELELTMAEQSDKGHALHRHQLPHAAGGPGGGGAGIPADERRRQW